MKQIIVHQEKCTACRDCELACSFSHEGVFNPALSRIRVNDFYQEQFYLPMTCVHCADAPCATVVKLFKLTLAALGRFREEPADDVKLLSGGRDLYRKIVVDREGVIVGAVYLGDENGVAEMGVIHGMIRRRTRWRDLARYHLPRITYATLLHAAPHHG